MNLWQKCEKLFRLTPRESQVARQIARGHGRKRIARELEISPSTVDKFRQTLRWKCAVENTFELHCLFYRYLPTKR